MNEKDELRKRASEGLGFTDGDKLGTQQNRYRALAFGREHPLHTFFLVRLLLPVNIASCILFLCFVFLFLVQIVVQL